MHQIKGRYIGYKSDKFHYSSLHYASYNKPFHSSSFRYRLTYIDRYVINSGYVMRTGYFLSQPITTLENVSFISLAQPELKKLWIISQTNYLTVAYLLVDNVSTCKC